MKKTTLVTLAMFAWLTSYTQKVEWADYANSTAGFDPGMGVVTDVSGNVYVLGEISNQAIFQGDTFTNQYGSVDLILFKYTPQGNFVWGKVFGGTGSDAAYDLAIDAAGHLYASVFIQSVVMMNDTTYTPPFRPHIIQFDTASNFRRYISKNQQILVDATGIDVYIAYASTVEKLDTAFGTQWSRTASPASISFSDPGPQAGLGDIMVGNNGHLVVSGHESAGGLCTFDTVTLSFAALCCHEIFVIAMDTSGSALWAATLDSSSTVVEGVPEVAVDDSGNVYLAFNSAGDTIHFANSVFFNTPITNDYSVLFKYAASGIPQWGIGYYTSVNSSADINDMLINPQQEVVLCGYSTGGGQFGNYILPATGIEINPFVAKVNTAGVVVWYKTDENLSPGTSNFQSLFLTANGQYAVTGFFPSVFPGGYRIGCFSAPPNSRDIVTFILSENPEPSAAFTYSWSGLTFTFTDQSIGATSWHWDFGDGDTSSQQHPVHTYLVNGNYLVTLTINDSLCGAPGQANISIGVATEETDLFRRWSAGPNPFGNFLDVMPPGNTPGKKTYELADITGKIVLRGTLESRLENKYRIATSELNSGVYFITLMHDESRKTFKVLKVH